MSIVLITGNHPRHGHLVSRIAQSANVVGWIREVRESFIPSPPVGLDDDICELFATHFNRRDEAEAQFFGASVLPDVPRIDVALKDLNGEQVNSFLSDLSPHLVISYGCHKLNINSIAPAGTTFWNTHGGLSPDYRGVTTHFWPSYFLEPQMTGMTLHETTEHIDGGAIVFQNAGTLVAGDGLHQLAARTVFEYAELLANKLVGLDFENLPCGYTQSGSGRLFLARHWRPEHLRLVYQQYNDRIVDAVLEGTLEGHKPSLVSVL